MDKEIYNSIFQEEIHDLIALKRALGFSYRAEAGSLRFFICVNMCIVSAPFPGDSFRRNICRNPDIVEISAENPHDTDTACLICDCLISSFSAP